MPRASLQRIIKELSWVRQTPVTVTIPVNAMLGPATLIADTGKETTKPIPFEIIESARQ